MFNKIYKYRNELGLTTLTTGMVVYIMFILNNIW